MVFYDNYSFNEYHCYYDLNGSSLSISFNDYTFSDMYDYYQNIQLVKVNSVG